MSRRNFSQPSLADAFVKAYSRGGGFLEDIAKTFEWSAFDVLMRPLHSSSEGAPAYPPLTMYKIVLLQQWHGLLDHGLAALTVVQVGAGHFCLTHDAARLVHRQMRLVAEVSLVVLDRKARVGVARADLTLLDRRRFHRRGDDRGVHQRAALDDQSQSVELPVHLGKQRLRQAELLDPLPEPPDRRMVRRLLVERNAAKAAKRQPIAHRFLCAGVGKPVPLLQEHDLVHRQRRIGRRSLGRRMKWTHQDVESRPLERLGDVFQEPAASRIGLDERVGERRLTEITARHRRLTSSECRRESWVRGFCKGLPKKESDGFKTLGVRIGSRIGYEWSDFYALV